MKAEDYFDSQLGIDIWNNKYRQNNESFDEWLDRVSGGNESVRMLIEQKKFMFGGRILANRGINDRNVSLSNCYVITPPEDNLESIWECSSKFARTFSYGGGAGTSLSNLAPKGSIINNAAKYTSGAVSFAELINKTTELIGQDGRRGATMLSLSSEHPDIFEFIDAKTNNNEITKCNLSVEASNKFMRNAMNNQPHELRFKRHTGELIVDIVSAKDMLKRMATNACEWSEPGIMFIDRMNKYNLLEHYKNYNINSTNPCVTGDTKILTSNGYVRIDSVVDKNVNVWNGYQFSTVTPKITGHDEDIYKVTFSDGSELKCTGYHKFITFEGYSRDGKEIRKQCTDLEIGDKLTKCNFPVLYQGETYDRDLMYTQGFYSGDGTHVKCKGISVVWLYGKKIELVDKLLHDHIWVGKDDKKIGIQLSDVVSRDKCFVPDISFSVTSRLDWLAGLIDSDGCKNSVEGSISISSIHRDFLIDIKHMLNTLGINAHVNMMKESGFRMLPDGNGGLKEYYCNDAYRLVISAYNARKLIDLGLELNRVELYPNPNRNAGRFIKVLSVEKLDYKADNVYCFNEPNNHSGIFNGVLTANCGEQPLPDGGACLLGSINLAEIGIIGDDVDYYDLCNVVDNAVIGLNEVLHEGMHSHPLREQIDAANDWRQIGLGVMGYADLLIKLGLRYGSDEAIEFTETLMKSITNIAFKASSKYAEDNGVFPEYVWELIANSEFFTVFDVATKKLIYDNGLANATVMSIAPTGSISTMLGVSGGIEPHYALNYKRKTESLHGEDKYYDVNAPIVQWYVDKYDTDELPDYFVTAMDIHPQERLETQEVFQKYVDAAISSTINLPNSATVEDVEDIYINAWKLGLKGVTVHRQGNKREGILTVNDISEDKDIGMELKRGDWEPEPTDLASTDRDIYTGCGQIKMFIRYSRTNNKIFDFWIKRSGKGGCERSLDNIAVAMSGMLRLGGNISNIEKAFEGIGVCNSFSNARKSGQIVSKGNNCGDAMLRKLLEFKEDVDNDNLDVNGRSLKDIDGTPLSMIQKQSQPIKKGTLCPDCGTLLAYAGGCIECRTCGYSKCD